MHQSISLTNAFECYLGEQVTSSNKAALLNITTPCEFKADQPFVTQGQPTHHLYFFDDAIVRYFITSEDGREGNKTFTQAPCIVGSTYALLTGKTCKMSIAPLKPCQALSLDWQVFRNLMDQHHDIDKFYRVGLEKLFMMKEARESEFLLMSAEQRYRQFIIDHQGFWQSIPQYHIASYLGISPVSLSRLRHAKK